MTDNPRRIGIKIGDGGSLRASGLVIRGQDVGVEAGGGASVELGDALIEDVAARGLAVPDERLTIYANSDVSRGKYAAAAVHAALMHYGIDHGAVIVLGARASQIEERCDLVVHDAGRTEVKPGTATAGIARDE